ncbi:hypothetical protein ACOSP7_023712 [Xanthoceras sorbifolium]
MEEAKRADQDKNDGTHLSHKHNEQPTNLLERFWLEKTPKETQNSNPEPDLNLSLSLGSIDYENPLARSSSIAGDINLRKDSFEAKKSFLSLERSCSMPTEMRKEEAKKRLVEGQNSAINAKGKEKSPMPPKVAAWPSKALAPTPPIVKFKEEQFSEIQTGPAAANAANNFESSVETKNVELLVTSGTNSNANIVKAETNPENPFKRPRISHDNFEENGMEVMTQMPSVSTTGDGPNGRKVKGFLYKYMKGQVSIVCVCHGSFLSPAEFVKHAGGRDVLNPMKHITVRPTFSV